jgi:hypothetical protein
LYRYTSDTSAAAASSSYTTSGRAGGQNTNASQEGEVHIKAAWIKGTTTYAVKVAAGYYSNPALYNLPSGSVRLYRVSISHTLHLFLPVRAESRLPIT